MDTVNRVVETASKAIWGEQDGTTTTTATKGSQATASNSQNSGMTGIESVDKVVNAGKKALWGDDQSSTPHGEEPVAGKRGLGTATDPYDAGNRDEQVGAPPIEAGGLPTNGPATEQLNVETTSSSVNNMGGSSGTAGITGVAAATPDLKTTVSGLRPDPSQPGNTTVSSLKQTSTPFEDEAQKLAKDLQSVEPNKTTTGTTATAAPVGARGTAVGSQNATKHSKDDSLSSTSTGSSFGSSSGQKSKTSKLEKVKNKLHIGHSQKPSR